MKTTRETAALDEFQDLYNDIRANAMDYAEEHDVDTTAGSVWRVIASQATEKLTDKWFTFGVTSMETFGNPGKAINEAINSMGASMDPYTAQQVALWEETVISMLGNEIQLYPTEGIHDATDTIIVLNDSSSQINSIAESLIDIKKISSRATTLADTVKSTTALVGDVNSAGYAQQVGNATTAIVNSDAANKQLANANKALMKSDQVDGVTAGISYLLAFLDSAIAGGEAADKVSQYRSAYNTLSMDYATNAAILDALYTEAATSHNVPLQIALTDIYVETTNEYYRQVDIYASELEQMMTHINNFAQDASEASGAFLDESAETLYENVLSIGLGICSPVLSVGALGATVADLTTNHGEVYDSAERLMALAQMSSSMDLFASLDNETETDYYFKLWAALQEQGCDQAKDFISQHSDSGWGQVKISELGIDANERNSVNKKIDDEKTLYQEFSSSESAEERYTTQVKRQFCSPTGIVRLYTKAGKTNDSPWRANESTVLEIVGSVTNPDDNSVWYAVRYSGSTVYVEANKVTIIK